MQQPMNLKEHWNHVYQTKPHDDVSWYQSRPATSLQLIEGCGVDKQEGMKINIFPAGMARRGANRQKPSRFLIAAFRSS